MNIPLIKKKKKEEKTEKRGFSYFIPLLLTAKDHGPYTPVVWAA
jgi:hypothetical protein